MKQKNKIISVSGKDFIIPKNANVIGVIIDDNKNITFILAKK